MSNIRKKGTILSDPSFKEAAWLCVENAEQFIKDSELLITNKSYGHALSLAFLADEELAKATLFFVLAQGRIELDDQVLKEVLKLITKHSFKQGLQAESEFFHIIFLPLLEEISKLVKDFQESPRILDPEAVKKEIVSRYMQKAEKIREERVIENRTKWFKDPDSMKQRGFYVDFDDEGRPVSPKEIPQGYAQEYLDQVKMRLDRTKTALSQLAAWNSEITNGETLSDDVEEALKKIAQGLVMVMIWGKGYFKFKI